MRKNDVPYLIMRLKDAANDGKLEQPGNNGRKVIAISLCPAFEKHASVPAWRSAAAGKKTPIVVTGDGGLEVSTFSQTARQDFHKHKRGTECYTVLSGDMKVRLSKRKAITLHAGDELVVFPGTVHEILAQGKFVARVHSVNSFGAKDKFIKKNSHCVPR